jgi:hypothetical protein
MQQLNSTDAAALIRDATGRQCSRQNLENLCKKGRLPRSVVSLKPIRVRAETVVAEYLSVVDPRQQETAERKAAVRAGVEPLPVAARVPIMMPPALDDGPPLLDRQPLPDYNESRARHEFEKANLAELDRKTKEGLLLPRDQVEKAWAAAVTIARTKLLATPTRVRQRIPHLSLEEVDIIDWLLREALEELAGGVSDGN